MENTVGKGEIAWYKQFLLFPQCFQKTWTADMYKTCLVLFGKGLDYIGSKFLLFCKVNLPTDRNCFTQHPKTSFAKYGNMTKCWYINAYNYCINTSLTEKFKKKKNVISLLFKCSQKCFDARCKRQFVLSLNVVWIKLCCLWAFALAKGA